MFNILIIDDEQDIREIISDTLSDEGYKTLTAHNVKSAMDVINSNLLHLVILDIWLEGHHTDGIGLLRMIKKQQPNTPVIMISGHANTEIAVQTIKLGAYDFIEKPFKTERLLILTKHALEVKQLTNINALLQQNQRDEALIGNSKAIVDLRKKISNVANNNSRVLISGEIGVGKSVLAKMLHYNSKRADFPFVHLQTHGKNEEQLIDDLLGNPQQGKVSLLEIANGGTLFIDEVANLTTKVQEKLLAIVQNNVFVSGKHTLGLNVRFVTSTAKDLDWMVENKLFNKTLLLRLNTVRLHVPPLRERKQDIVVLTQYFCQKLSHDFAAQEYILSDSAYSLMMVYDWPGNIRQLHNVLEKLVLLSQKRGLKEIDKKMISNELFENEAEKADISSCMQNMTCNLSEKNYRDAKNNFERDYLKIQLERFDYNITKTADFIGMDRTALHRKLNSLGVVIKK
jgi:two-component system, NtrC family, nitrogen regulation response regulator NtrX